MATAKTTEKVAQELMTEDVDYLGNYEGEGFDDMGSSAVSVAYLGLVQPDSEAAAGGDPEGTWRNSATGKNYGKEVNVIAFAFRTIWSEREEEPPFRTVGRYPVGGIEVETKYPPKGKRGFPKMINPETGNEVQELFVYAAVLPEHPEDGVLYFNPTVGSMKTAKSWNSQLKGQILPNGTQAPIFGYQWTLVSALVPNPQQPNKQIAKFVAVNRGPIVNKEMFENHVAQRLAAAKQDILMITSGTFDEPAED